MFNWAEKIYYDETKGYQIFSHTKAKSISDADSKYFDEIDLKVRYLAFASLNALISYLELVKGIYLFYDTLRVFILN